jgi:hypothetical protein
VTTKIATRTKRTLRWWHEVVFVLVFYGVYSAIRNTQGSARVASEHAFHNAKRVIRIENDLGVFHEAWIQHRFIHMKTFIQFWNVFYGSAHFIVTIVALIWLFRRSPERYPVWRNTLAFTTGLALIGFALFPLMPPRLLHTIPGTHYGFVDTLQSVGGLWSFDSGTMKDISNQYAAMPSLHCAWATWCALVMYPMVKRPWAKALVVIYPFLTVFGIVVTANHYLLDAVGGLFVLGMGFLLGAALARYRWGDDVSVW